MPKHRKNLSWASYEGPDPEISLTSDDWRELEKTYGQELTDEVRNQLIEVANRYLFSVQPERSAAKITDVKDIAEQLDRKFEPFFRFAYGERNVHVSKQAANQYLVDDAYIEFENRFEMQLKKRPLGIDAENLNTNKGPLPPEFKKYLATNVASLELDVTTIRNVALNLRIALEKIKAEIGQEIDAQDRSGFVPGRAFGTLLIELRDWARKNRLPYSYRVSGEAGPLAKLCFRLNRKIDPKYRDNIASEEAVYDRWSAAKKQRSQDKGGF